MSDRLGGEGGNFHGTFRFDGAPSEDWTHAIAISRDHGRTGPGHRPLSNDTGGGGGPDIPVTDPTGHVMSALSGAGWLWYRDMDVKPDAAETQGAVVQDVEVPVAGDVDSRAATVDRLPDDGEAASRPGGPAFSIADGPEAFGGLSLTSGTRDASGGGASSGDAQRAFSRQEPSQAEPVSGTGDDLVAQPRAAGTTSATSSSGDDAAADPGSTTGSGGAGNIHAPTDMDLSANSIAEDAAGGTVVGTLSATDADSGNVFTYTLTGGATDTFEIVGDELRLKTGASLDYETATSHPVTVTVDDGNGNTYQEAFTVNVTDVNDNAQVFTSGSSASAAENVSDSAVIYTATTTDVDTTGEAITYSLVDDAGGLFEIDASTGEVTLATGQSLDYETATSHNITVRSTDGTNSTDQAVTINVTDVNDTAATDMDLSANSIAEDAAGGTVVGTLSATDADSGNVFTYTLTGGATDTFEIVGDELRLKTGASLDYETATSHPVTVTVDDGNGNTYQEAFTVNVTDVNDNAQVFTSGSSASAAENVSDSAVLYTATTTDVDTTGEAITYSLVDDAGGLFEIDASTGEVTLATGQSLDYETATSHSITVRSTDGTNSTDQAVTINVTDVNDTAATDMDLSANSIAEDAAGGTVVGTLSATDADTGNVFTYTLTGGATDTFEIVGDELRLKTGASLDYETATSHPVTVTVDDGNGNTYQEAFTVNVTDVNDNAQVFTSGSSASAAENVSDSAVLYTATTTDVDTTGEAITYSLVDDAGGLFEIDASTGEVTLATGQSLDYETATSHSITVRSTDGTNSTDQAVTINVTDVNDTAATDMDLSANSIAEDAAGGTVVGTLSATDADTGNVFTYTLTGGATDTFEIVGDELRLKTGASLDYETATSHPVTVTVDDGNGNTYQEAFTVNVTDVNDNAQVFTSGSSASAAENVSDSAVIYTATTTDVDTTGEAITYSLVDDAGGLFEIDASTGEVTLVTGQSLDYETATSHSITVRSTDGTNSTDQAVTINVTDVNDTAATDMDLSANSIAEDAAGGTVVGTLSATDADSGNVFTYTLTGGATDTFEIVGDELRLKTGASLDYETATSHPVTVTVDDGNGNTYQEAFTVNVTDVNDNAQVFTSGSSASAAENVSDSAVIYTATTTDVDTTGEAITYSLVDDAGGLFEIDASTGEVTLATGQSLDYETATSHNITVRSTDGTNSTDQAVTINVTDVNDTAATDMDLSANSIAEDAAGGTAVGTLSATDADSGNVFTYTLTGGATDTFEIVGDELRLKTGASLDYETATSHPVTVTVDDGNGNTYQEAFTVNVTDVNDNAQVFTSGSSASAAENVSDSAVIYTATTTDVDTTGEAITYSLVDDAGGLFEIDASTGEVTLATGQSLDYETATSHNITVRSTDGTNSTDQAVTINVTDVNDTAATDMDLSANSIAEDAAGGTVVGTLSATDADTGNVFTYTLTGGATDTFEIVGDELRLKTGASLDYETATSHPVTVTVDDGNGNTYQEAFTVNVTDVNDNAQVFTSGSSASAAENVSDSAVIYTATTTDVDTTGEAITYSLVDDAGGLFEIDASTGEVTLATGQSLDYETATSHSITVRSTDGTNSTDQAVTINVTDVNDTAATDMDLSANSIAEDAAGGTVVGTLSATDADTGNVFTYTLTGGATDTFEIVGDELRLKTGASLDYETATSHPVTVTVDDGNGNTYQEAFTVNVTDVNDNAQVFTSGSSASAAENVSDSAVIYTATTTDVDTTGEAITYSLVDDAGGLFEIDASTGEVTLVTGQSLDYETATSHSITVRSTDGTNSTDQAVTINVTDVNDTAATDMDLSANSIAEDAAGGTVVGTLSATDADSGNVFTYTLTGGATDTFEIVGDELRLKTGASLDYETATSHPVTVTVDDGNGNTYQEAFTVNVTDVNDNAQVFTSGSSASAAENVSDSAVIYTATTTDVDTTGEAITYSLVDDAGGLFEIDASTGEVTLATGQSLDYETATSHNITVRSTDGTNSTDQAVTINVTDVNDTAATDMDLSANSIAEDAAGGTVVGTLSATDADTGNVFTYTLTGGATDTFEIVGDELRLKTGASLDYETATSHPVTVTVDDGNGNTYQEAFTVNVTDVNDNAQVFTSGSSASAAENVSDSAVIYTATTTDVDTTGEAITYSLVDDAGGLFEIDASTGEVTLATGQSLDYETATSHNITVRSTDGTNSTDQAVTINVTDVNDTAATDMDLSANSIAEDAAGGTVVGTLSATDADSGNVFTYTLTGGATDTFEIVGDELRLKTGASLDYETATSHPVTVTVDDGNGNTYQEAFTVNVTDVNDNAQVFTSGSSASAAENVSDSAVIYTATTTDVDTTGEAITYSLVDDAGGLFEIDASTGEVTLATGQSLDYETATSHSITVRSTDGTNSTDQAVTINVTDVNDTAATDMDLSANSIAEDAAGGTVVGTLSATDADTGNVFTYTLTGGATDTFEIVGDELRLKTGASLDYETATSHPVTVTVDDGNGNTYQEAFTVNVTDVNDNAQVFTSGSSASAAENVSDSAVIYTATTTDVDTTGEAITYSLVDDAGGLFEIDASTGEVTLATGQSLDYETATSHNITVRSTDGTNSTDQAVTINVTDVNDTAATDMDLSANSIAEDAAGGTVVGTLSATDADTGNVFTYTLTGGATDTFEIVGDELRLKTGASLDYETATSHPVTVTVDDGNGNTYQEAFTVNVTDVNDNAQVFTSGSSARAAENVSDSAVIYTATTTDVDTTGEAITYSLVDDAGGLFEIDASTGEVTLATGQSLDYETATSHSITVRSTDGTNSTDQAVTINVTDVNDTAATDMDLSANSIAEDAAGGTVVGTLSATDADSGNVFTYTLTGGATDTFEIVGDELRLKTGASLDYETATSHPVTVTVDDGNGNTYQEAFTVNVTDVNDNAQVFTSGSSASAAENVSDSAVIYTATTTDVDTTGEAITYSLVDDAGGLFEIDASTGEVTLATGQSLDYETATSHSITVRSTDGTNSTDQAVTINVTDVNDTAATDMDLSANSIAEDAAGGTVVGTLSATDADTGNVFTYTLTGGATDTFEIVGDELRLKTGASLDYETATSHPVTVTVDDGNGNTYQEAFTVNVTDVNDNAQVFTSGSSASAAESVADTAVLYTATTTDVDTTGEAITYSLVDDAGGLFEIDASTGEVTLATGQSLDYETATSHNITVRSTDGTNSTDQAVTINVTDVNDTAATDMDLSANSIAEDAAGGTVVGTLSATDADSGNVFTYTLTGGATDTFEIVGDELRLKTGASLDYETATSHPVTVTVDDGNGNTYQEAFTVNVTDVNDNAQVFTSGSSASAAENVSDSAVIYTATTTDVDTTGEAITYSLVDDAGGLFEIDASTGEVTLATGQSLDYETATSHSITVRSTDGTNSTDQAVTINVTDVNDTAATDMDLSANSIAEDAAGGTVVGTLSATDADSGNVFTYTLTGGATDTFEIVGDELRLKTGASLDYETATSHPVTVTVDDGNGNTYQEAFTVNVTDVNDNAQVFTSGSSASAAENVSDSAVIYTATTTDVDTTGEAITYSLVDDAGGLFEIDASTGEVTLATGQSLDYETATSHNITVRSTDGTNSTDQAVTINVTDANDAPSDLALTETGGIALNTDGGNNAYLYATDSGDLLGGLTEATVEVAFQSNNASNSTFIPLFSYHAGGSSDEFTVVIDTDDQRFDIEVGEQTIYATGYDPNVLLDGKEHQVSFTWDNTSGDWAIYVDGTSVLNGTGLATGHTIASGGTIVLGQEQDSNAGSFDTTQVFDGTIYDVRIFNDARTAQEISDNAFGQVDASESGLVADWRMDDLSGGVTTDAVSGHNLSVGNVTGTGWVASTPSLVTGLIEGAANGHLVGQVSASDQDAGETFTYSLVDDADGLFAIDATTGEITIADNSRVDYDQEQSHQFTVQVTDSGGASYQETYSLSVQDDGAESTSDSYEAAVMGHDPVAYLRLDAAADGVVADGGGYGDTAADETGNHNGTYNGGTDPESDGPFNNISTGSTEFDGDNEYVQIAHSSDFELSSGTIQLWFNSDDVGSQKKQLVHKEGVDDLQIFIENGKITAGFGGDKVEYTGVTAGSWYHMSFSWGASGLQLYIDGDLKDTKSSSKNLADTDEDLFIGMKSTGNEYFDGSIAEFAVFESQLSEAEIDAIIDAGVNGYEVGTGTAGNDVLTGGGADEQFYGEAGDDSVAAGAGVDTVYAGEGDDSVAGDAGDDTVYGGDGADTISGGDGNDLLHGGAGNDTITGDAGNDIIHGGSGDDAMWGGLGNDTLIGGTGDDTLYGEAGDDLFIMEAGGGNDVVTGGTGTNWIEVQDVAQAPNTGDWTYTLTNGSVTNTGGDYVEFTAGADGYVELTDGTTMTFTDIDRIEW